MSKLIFSGLRGLFVPIVIVSVLFVAFAAYYFYWVPDRQRHLDDRGFRFLKTLSDQIRLKLNTYDKMLDNAVDSRGVTGKEGVDDDRLERYLRLVAPQLTPAEAGEIANVIGNDYGDPPKLAITADEGTHFLYMAFGRSFGDEIPSRQKIARLAVRTDLDKLVSELLGPQDLIPFDAVLVAQTNGKVIYQKSLSGIEVAEIKNLEDASGQAKANDEKRIGIELLAQTSRLDEVRIAGARYRLYSQPLQIGFLMANPNKTTTAADRKIGSSDAGQGASAAGAYSGDASADWVLCGMVRADRFRSESQLIPYSYILMMLAVILLAAASYPYLKLYLSMPGERLRARDVAITTVSTCFILAVITIVLIDVYFWHRIFGPATVSDMAKLANAMNANFIAERDAAVRALDEMSDNLHPLDRVCMVKKKLQATRTRNVSLLFGKNGTQCDPSYACEVDILTKTEMGLPSSTMKYPYLLFAFWTDAEGNQRVKWTTRPHATPFILFDDASEPFYPEVRRALKYSIDQQPATSQGIGLQYSATTGQNTTTFWKVVTPVRMKCPGVQAPERSVTPPNQSEQVWAGIVTQPVSFYNPVLPAGYKFAVLAPDGTVVFHSDHTRNLRENFLAEADTDPGLHSRIKMRAEGFLIANYMGRPHRMYVLPMPTGNQDGLWTLVVFRDLHIEEVMNLEVLSLVSILAFLYVAAISLVMFFAQKGTNKIRKHWYWPDSRNSKLYSHLVWINLIAGLLLLVLSRLVPPLALLLFAVGVPALVILWNMLSLSNRETSEAPFVTLEANERVPWHAAYFLSAAVLTMVISVLPCLCFFKVAADFEYRILVEHTLVQLAEDFDARYQAMKDLYQEVNLPPPPNPGQAHQELGPSNPVLALPEDQDATGLELRPPNPSGAVPVFSYHSLLGLKVSSAPTKDDSANHDVFAVRGCGSVGHSPDVDAFLSCLSYPYNERAANDKHLAEQTSDVWQWHFERTLTDRTVVLLESVPGGQARAIRLNWLPFHFRWLDWLWSAGAAVFIFGAYWLVRLIFIRMFLLDLVAPPPPQESSAGRNPASLIADLPMNLLLIGHETSRPIVDLLHRSDVQVHEATELLEATATPAKPLAEAGFAKPLSNPIDAMIRDKRPLVLRNFERLPDDAEKIAKVNAALTRILSALGNSVILVSSLDPVLVPSIEASDRWRSLLRSFVRIDLNTTPRQRVGEEDADYQSRVCTESYYHWLFADLPRLEKLVMLQLAQEKVVNPNSSEIVDELMEIGMIERRYGLLAVKDKGFHKFLKHALPHHTVKHWEREFAGARPFPLQTSLMIVGIGVVAFLVYTQGDVFNTWVTYATGVAATVPKILQFLDNLRSKTARAS